MINFKEDEKLNHLNHSTAHLLAQAVKRMYPSAKFWVGPVIDSGFYYDMDLGDVTLTEEDLEKIEKEMKKCSKEASDIVEIKLTKEEALEMFKDDPYKLDLISNMEGDITAYKQREFIDLCRGGHVKNTKEIKYFKLIKVSGAYFKGDSKNKMLQRVYGVSFETEEDLNKYLEYLEEVKKRDHRKLGKELELFMTSEYTPGNIFYLPNGMTIYKELEKFWYEEHIRNGYKIIKTPIILNKTLWETSGHWDNYKENMYTTKVDDEEYAIKPMNCPGAMLVFKNSVKSYRDLPLRLGELGLVHRHEASGALSGLFRVRSFTQDDAHIFMRESQIEDEIRNKVGKPYKLNPQDGAFYGPKLDVKVIDSLGRSWQCATIQLDMQLPIRFDLSYINEENQKEAPVIVHRVIYGSFERMMGILIEHFAGAFPAWLAPVQVNILPINNELHAKNAEVLYKELLDMGIRVEVDNRNEKFGYKMRESQMRKIPINIILGDSEIQNNEISYRLYGEEKTTTLSKDAFMNFIIKLINERA